MERDLFQYRLMREQEMHPELSECTVHGISDLSEAGQTPVAESVFPGAEESSVHPDVQAKMAAWDRRTGRSSSRNPMGPLSAERRAEISRSRTIPESRPSSVGNGIGQPMSDEHKQRQREGMMRRIRSNGS